MKFQPVSDIERNFGKQIGDNSNKDVTGGLWGLFKSLKTGSPPQTNVFSLPFGLLLFDLTAVEIVFGPSYRGLSIGVT